MLLVSGSRFTGYWPLVASITPSVTGKQWCSMLDYLHLRTGQNIIEKRVSSIK